MATKVDDVLGQAMGSLRYHPGEQHVRAAIGGTTVVDSRGCLLVWEPRRVVPSYAVPETAVSAELLPGVGADDPGTPALPPGASNGVHTAEGAVLDVALDGVRRPAAALRLADPDLAGHVVLEFDAFDEWWEEDERLVGHARDPFHRVDVRRSSRSVRIEAGDLVLAESTRPTLVFETELPTRFYLPREDVRLDLLEPTATVTACAYKGFASYWSVTGFGDLDDVCWSYEQPLPDAPGLAGLMAFFDERVDVVLDGVRRPRPRTFWSRD